MFRVAAIIVVSIIHFTISQAAFSQYHVLPKIHNIHKRRAEEILIMLKRSWALKFAEEWIASWNSHDLEKILSHYTEDFEMSSPLIVQRLGREDGVLKGKHAVADYWNAAISQEPPVRFELRDVLVGINQLTIYYHSVGRNIVAETLTFDNELKVIAGAAQWSVISG